MGHNVFVRVYYTWFCHWCRRHFKNGELIHYSPSLEGLRFCGDCCGMIESTPDYNPEGSRDLGTRSWTVARKLVLWRDDYKCRICGKYYRLEREEEPRRRGVTRRRVWNDVHHIVPVKDGGTHHPANLVTLCEKHHKETYSDGYGGLQITDRLITLGVQKQL